MNAPRFSEMEYTVFMSYARDDDDGWNGFITNFNEELNTGLKARFQRRDISLPDTYFDMDHGPVSGPLNDSLREAVEKSFAMMLFVHDGYVSSPWCLQELQHFHRRFGPEGFKERLYIVAMSLPAMKALMNHRHWKELFPYPDQVWMPFFQDGGSEKKSTRPLEIYSAVSRGKRAVVTNEFWRPFVELRERMVKQLVTAADAELAALELAVAMDTRPTMLADTASASSNHDVMIYIESEPTQEHYWQPLSQQVASVWDQVVAMEVVEPPLLLRPTGMPMHDLHHRPRLDGADGVILLWREKTPESLLAQIAMVEPKLSGPNLAPGLIAYLMEVGKPAVRPVPETMQNWPVVRFAVRRDEPATATVLADDAPKLAKFLRGVLSHERQCALHAEHLGG